eukprot:g1848.t1
MARSLRASKASSYLRNLRDWSASYAPREMDHTRLSAVAVVLRVHTSQGVDELPVPMMPQDRGLASFVSAFGESGLASHEDTRLEMLFMKRASRDSDIWGGQVSLPGGKAEEQDAGSAVVTAIRETREELGLDLTANGFVKVGQLDDRPVFGNAGRIEGFITRPFLFLQLGAGSRRPELELQPSEVAAAKWVDIHSSLRSEFVDPEGIQIKDTPFGSFTFPSINLPEDAPTTLADPTQVGDIVPPFQLWGMTLRMTADVLDVLNGDDDDGTSRLVEKGSPR